MAARDGGSHLTNAQSLGIVIAIIAASLTTSLTVPPILPKMIAHFRDVPGVTFLVPLVVSLPLLISTIAAPLSGLLSDRIGRRQIVIWASVLSTLLGVLPYFLDSLPAILSARAFMGLTTGALLACTSALIGDFFAGSRRQDVLGAKYATLGVAHIFVFVLIGHLAETNWRNAFWIFLWGLVAAVLVTLFIPRQPELESPRAADGRADPPVPVPWLRFASIFVGVYLGMATFDVALSGVPFLLEERGIHSTRIAGYVTAVASGGMLLGATSYPFLARRIPGRTLWCVTFGVASIGYFILALSEVPLGMSLGTLAVGMGCGLVPPNSLNMLLGAVPMRARGRVTGVQTVFFFLGLASGPLVGVSVGKLLGSSALLFAILAAALVAIGFVYTILAWRGSAIAMEPERAQL